MSSLNHAVRFEKYHGTGNDFIIVDATDPIADRGRFATTYCDRTGGVGPSKNASTETLLRTGADGVLFLALEDRFSPPRVVMTLVQPDGSVAPTCGNGTRCAAVWAMDRTGTDAVMIDTQAGTRCAVRESAGIAVEMGTPMFEPERVPLSADQSEPLIETTVSGLPVTAVNTGVPHAVTFVEDVSAVDVDDIAPAVRHADVFPDGVNVTFAERIDSDGDVPRFRQRTYERGIEGETDACGTGSVAIAAVARRLGLIAADQLTVDISLRGGDLRVTAGDRGETLLIGPVAFEFDGELSAVVDPK